jgi:hypothetical protein
MSSLLLHACVPSLPFSRLPTSSRQTRLFGAVRNRVLGLLPLLDERQELRLSGDVLAQDLRDVEALGGLVVFEDAAQRALSRTYYFSLANAAQLTLSKDRERGANSRVPFKACT